MDGSTGTGDAPRDEPQSPPPPGDSSEKKKGKRKAKGEETPKAPAGARLTDNMAGTLLEMNPALRGELAGMDREKAAEMLRRMDISELLTGLSLNQKNQKDMASYKFWQTQPVIRFDDKGAVEDGPIKQISVEDVPKTPDPLIEGFEWVTLDLDDEKELKEFYELLSDHYVEDGSAMFRFNYSPEFLNWALKAPGWKKDWHVGVRASKSGKLVASICGVPAEISVRGQLIKVSEINFLCIHKKLRSKRLTPVLIKEITRRCNVDGIFQAIYTAGIILPTPVSSCRYYHRALDWLKLYEVGFSALPAGSTKARQITRNHLPSKTATPGLRPMQSKDVDAVHDLLNRYMKRFDLAQTFSREEIEHLFVHKEKPGTEQTVFAYVVEEDETHKITDFVSFYSLESTVIHSEKHNTIRAAYMYYYASETAFAPKEKGLRERLTLLVNDALILAKKEHFDVFNALTLHDNPLFLEQLKFGPGDGQLHYYLFNYRTSSIAGGVNERNFPDEKKRGGVGIVLV
ncbi:glycylpeptide N-tetradecanoyltransferase [Coccidioides posadasii str. Silveira]|uniref:Glycylpeptide N-tetradecanoyltransferase n=3 Tax=Coccidioides posadasii TaxID=199306 RepID=E9D6I8_COCPS|nr:Glycylpeptide N-tetradecanoyltransferase, putative [Coccidioides posadasii C735 delta SOWgp]EER28458.1 Glycylpeptide N-tetradecanoyltransferase, putative [Coccidioides posadasii C735 delta SOWgp]EFW17860.1 glycylpeptide N-tetradecanoyltransferase [Coccidioides posadasii str. Silveira]KMM68550.1 glycylpeptide N-tetradecanoyltransferase [Coccidioides posadasii RMSCC 3488]QVM10144.1 glycylpeptide N-tetradecanoyltransferase [Coccidioides posadasii str. Silveira]|eukprot:XP_003070603.1 Glycylpeptide N-tetradecanoyltransferase, putative [Coccidioides posadasii C735 delta SOWgp]